MQSILFTELPKGVQRFFRGIPTDLIAAKVVYPSFDAQRHATAPLQFHVKVRKETSVFAAKGGRWGYCFSTIN